MAALRIAVSPMTGDDDTRPLIVSWSIALAAAAAWLLVVHLTPTVVVVPPIVDQSPVPSVSLDPRVGIKRSPGSLMPSVSKRPAVRRSVSAIANLAGISAADVARRAFDEVTHAIPGVETVPGEVAANRSAGAKSALSAATAENTPGRTALGGGRGPEAGGGFGQVRQHTAVDRSEFHAEPLATVRAPAIEGQLADATELGAFVRGRVAQLQSCYELAGGTDLAGIVALRITIGPTGSVQSAEIVRRSWSGPAAASAEACLVRIARGWQLPRSDAGATATFPISFTRGA